MHYEISANAFFFFLFYYLTMNLFRLSPQFLVEAIHVPQSLIVAIEGLHQGLQDKHVKVTCVLRMGMSVYLHYLLYNAWWCLG